MTAAKKRLSAQRTRRTYRVRNRLRCNNRLRLSVFRTNKHIYAQIIDDQQGITLVSASTLEGDFDKAKAYGNVSAAETIGTLIAKRAIEKGVTQVAFDRGAYKYHGRVQALADAARKSGLDF